MQELDDLALKREIDAISKRIDTILQQVDQAFPSHPQPEKPVEKL